MKKFLNYLIAKCAGLSADDILYNMPWVHESNSLKMDKQIFKKLLDSGSNQVDDDDNDDDDEVNLGLSACLKDDLQITNRKNNLAEFIKNSNECPICEESVVVLKFLDCEHCVCEKCLEAASHVTNNRKVVKCPFDCAVTELPFGKVASLKSKLLNASLLCAGCDIEKPLSKLWWCTSCQMTLCRYNNIFALLLYDVFISIFHSFSAYCPDVDHHLVFNFFQ